MEPPTKDATHHMSNPLPADWDAAAAGEQLLDRLTIVTEPKVKGAHDSDFVIVDGKAYIIYMANDVQPGEGPSWPFVYNALTVVDLQSGEQERAITFAASEKAYTNCALPVGACFVPRILQKDDRTLRCFFCSESPGNRQSQTWYIDYDLERGDFIWELYQAQIATCHGVFPMQPRRLHEHLVTHGFEREPVMHGLYLIDGFKRFDGDVYCVLNNFPGGQLAWARLDEEMTRFTVIGELIRPPEAKLTETAINRLPDGSWLAISRQSSRDYRYMFSTSPDGRTWSEHAYRECIPDGASSKSNLLFAGGLYYMGWNEAKQVDGTGRSVFNIDVSDDGVTWYRKYHIETAESFQYATFHEAAGTIYLSATQGQKERIMFGKLEDTATESV